MVTVAEAVKAIQKSKDYKLLRRMPELIAEQTSEGELSFLGHYIDSETTGLDVEKDEIIELGAIPFKFTSAGKIVEIGEPYHCYNEPSKEITEQITKITKIDASMVKGCKLVEDDLTKVFADSKLIIAHNSQFDRPLVERYCAILKTKAWGCSMSQVPWERSKRLEHIVSDLGYFYDAHNAISDCKAGLFALQQSPGAMAALLRATREVQWHVSAIDAKYQFKDLLKERKYYWNGDKKCWHKFIKTDEYDLELDWLQKRIYSKLVIPATFDKITAKERFSNRR